MKDKKRTFVYISANHHPPFLHRYLDTKIEAENHLRTLSNLQFYSVRPGLIIDGERQWTYPLSIANNLIKIGKDQLDNSIGQVKYVKDLLEVFKVDKAIERKDLAKAICTLCLLNEDFPEVNFHEDILLLSKKFKDLINLN